VGIAGIRSGELGGERKKEMDREKREGEGRDKQTYV